VSSLHFETRTSSSELRPPPVDRKFGASREGRIESEEEDGLGDFLDVPKRFMGIMPIVFSLTWAAMFLSGNTLSRIGVSMGPGVTALTRISRGTSSAASVRANDRSAALAAPYVVWPGSPLTLATEVVRTTAPPRLIIGASFLTAKNGPLAFRLNFLELKQQAMHLTVRAAG
jgi:hypothetical protein